MKPRATFQAFVLNPLGEYQPICQPQPTYFLCYEEVKAYLWYNGDKEVTLWDYGTLKTTLQYHPDFPVHKFRGTGLYNEDMNCLFPYGAYNGDTGRHKIRIREVGHYDLEKLRTERGFMNAFAEEDRQVINAEDAYLKQVDNHIYKVVSDDLQRQIAFVDNNPEQSIRYWANWILCDNYPL